MLLSESGNCVEGGATVGQRGCQYCRKKWHRLRKELEGIVELALSCAGGGGTDETSKRPLRVRREQRSDKTRASEMDQTGAVSNGWGPGRGQHRVANTRPSSSGSGLEDGSSRWVGWERGLGQGVSTGWHGPGAASPVQTRTGNGDSGLGRLVAQTEGRRGPGRGGGR